VSNRSDDFENRAATLAGSTPSDGGSAWVDSASKFATALEGGVGPMVCFEGGPGTATTENQAWLEASTTDADVSAVIRRIDDAGGVILRVVDDNNYYLWRAKADHTTELYKKVSGSFTLLATGSVGFTAGSGATLKGTCSGTTIKGYSGASQSASVTDSALSAGTKYGIRTNTAFQFFDSFSVTDTAGGGTVTATPSPVVATASVVAPATTLLQAATPVTASAASVAPALTLNYGPSPVVATASVVAPSTSGQLSESPAAVSCAASVVGPALSLNQGASAVVVTGSVVAPATGVSPSPSPVVVTGSVVAPSTTLAYAASPVTTTGAVTAAAAGRVETPSPVVATAAAVAFTTALVYAPSPVVATLTVPAPSVTGGNLAYGPLCVEAGQVYQPGVVAGQTYQPGVAQGQVNCE
jgi:hypothetical protein